MFKTYGNTRSSRGAEEGTVSLQTRERSPACFLRQSSHSPSGERRQTETSTNVLGSDGLPSLALLIPPARASWGRATGLGHGEAQGGAPV